MIMQGFFSTTICFSIPISDSSHRIRDRLSSIEMRREISLSRLKMSAGIYKDA